MFRVLVFDLDDTILDTWHLLIPQAMQNMCEAMVQAGLNTTVEQCLDERRKVLLSDPRDDAYRHLVDLFGIDRKGLTHPPSADDIARIGYVAYHHVQVPDRLLLMEGVLPMLGQLRQKYRLHLLTSGDPETQRKKIAATGIESIFHHLWIVNPYDGQTKHQAFQNILNDEGIQPQQLLSIGNRIDREISEAKQLGCHTCFVRHGEYSQLTPRTRDEIPDYQIDRITDLIETCQL